MCMYNHWYVLQGSSMGTGEGSPSSNGGAVVSGSSTSDGMAVTSKENVTKKETLQVQGLGLWYPINRLYCMGQ